MTDYIFGKSSREKLMTCDPALRAVATRALELSPIDFTIVWGWRDQSQQNRMVAEKKSKTPWPQSKHNTMAEGGPCSRAFDFAPMVGGQIPWLDVPLFCVVAGVIFAAAKERNVKLRWGADWNGNWLTSDQTFMDWGHIELL
jgi:peptidoglycan L-alanyl-D-glutamate endopeptidase CwlK